MENNDFQALMLDQFAKMFEEFQELRQEFQELKQEVQELKQEFREARTDISELNSSQVRMENKFDEQISARHDFRVGQNKMATDNLDDHTIFNTKIEDLQFLGRIADGKLDEIIDDVNFLARKSFRQDKSIAQIKSKL